MMSWNRIILIGTLIGATQLASAEPVPGLDAAKAWLKLVDNGQYQRSWHDAAPVFQQRFSTDDWVNISEYARLPLGKQLSRTLINHYRAETAAGPENEGGTYIKLDFKTTFENRQAATERVTLHQEASDWQVTSYLIH